MRAVIAVCVVIGPALAAATGTLRAQEPDADLVLGRQVFEQNCSVCHSVRPPPRLAPPMSEVARQYLAALPDTAVAAARIAQWISSPRRDAAVMPPDVIKRFGLMPPLPLDAIRRRAVARYVLTLAGSAPGGT